ncbi:MAG: helix-turn-helix transcriptional regulator [Bacteroidales bacterium]
MKQYLSVIKGIHPGYILDRELKKRKLQKNKFADLLNEHLQTIVAITKARRGMNTALALKIEKIFGMEEGILMVLQAYYDVEQVKQKQPYNSPDLSKLRQVLFWDTKLDTINWENQKKAVIKRIFERGNETEKKEISRFYGENTVNEVLTSYGN